MIMETDKFPVPILRFPSWTSETKWKSVYLVILHTSYNYKKCPNMSMALVGYHAIKKL